MWKRRRITPPAGQAIVIKTLFMPGGPFGGIRINMEIHRGHRRLHFRTGDGRFVSCDASRGDRWSSYREDIDAAVNMFRGIALHDIERGRIWVTPAGHRIFLTGGEHDPHWVIPHDSTAPALGDVIIRSRIEFQRPPFGTRYMFETGGRVLIVNRPAGPAFAGDWIDEALARLEDRISAR